MLAIVLISVYVAVRFEWQYGIGALIATGHDVLVTAGLFSVFHMEFSINSVAALLLLAGYSINDTVVVFDRIRENRRKYKRMALPELINLSTNQIVTRTTLVSFATALTMLPLLIFGGRTCSASAPRSCSASWSARSRRPMSPRPCCSTSRPSADSALTTRWRGKSVRLPMAGAPLSRGLPGHRGMIRTGSANVRA